MVFWEPRLRVTQSSIAESYASEEMEILKFFIPQMTIERLWATVAFAFVFFYYHISNI